MTTAEIAITVSIMSALVAAFSLGWNIYRDVILKALVKTDLSISTIVQQGNPNRPEYVKLTATNHGPGPVTLVSVYARNVSFIKKWLGTAKYAFIILDHENPLSAQLPQKLEVGERIDILLPYDENCFLYKDWSHVGITDSFDRTHWFKKKQLKAARKEWKTSFEKAK